MSDTTPGRVLANTDQDPSNPDVQIVELHFPFGPVTYNILGSVNKATLDINLRLAGKLPFLPEVVLADGIKGNLKDGVDCTFDAMPLKGKARFYAKEGWIWMNLDCTALGAVQKQDIKLLPL